MGDFVGHFIPGAFFALIGVWHLVCILWSYATAPTAYTAKLWYPFPGALRHLELHFLIIAIPLDIIYELGLDVDWAPLNSRGLIPIKYLSGWEHSSMMLMFLIYAVAALLSAHNIITLPQGTTHILAGIAFFSEFLLFYFHSASHMGLEGHVHKLLSLIVASSALTCVLLAWQPHWFLLDLAGAMSLVFQGTWFMQTSFSMFLASTIPYGCHHMPDTEMGDGTTVCDTEKSTHRAQALMGLAFSVHLVCIVIGTLFLHAFLGYILRHQNKNGKYRISDVGGEDTSNQMYD